jgi:osmotically-inducible protein OsmY
LEGTGIKVKSVNQGVVLLSGTADSLMEHLEAIRAASASDGVRRVATEVETGDALYDTRLWHDAETSVIKRIEPGDEDAAAWTEPSVPAERVEPHEIIEDAADGGNPGLTEVGKLSDVMTDASITASIKMNLLEDADVPALSINVDTNDGVVTLFGQAYNAEQRKVAEAHARNVPGVVEVRNEIRLVDSDRIEERITDLVLEEEVRTALDKREPLRLCDIAVPAKDGVVRLTGNVPSRELKLAAASTARTVPGVRSVRNELQVARESCRPAAPTRRRTAR